MLRSCIIHLIYLQITLAHIRGASLTIVIQVTLIKNHFIKKDDGVAFHQEATIDLLPRKSNESESEIRREEKDRGYQQGD